MRQAGSARGLLHGALQDFLGLVMRGRNKAERVTAGATVVASLIMVRCVYVCVRESVCVCV